MERYDIAVIGGGVIGSAVARELKRFAVSVCVLERELDVVNGVSGRNTGLLHSGILYEKDSLRHRCVMESNREFDRVAEELDIPFKRTGKLIVGFSEEERRRLEALMERGADNGVPDIRMLDAREMLGIDPNAQGNFALFVPTAGILDPFRYTIALAESAALNGAQYKFDHEVTQIETLPDRTHILHTSQGKVGSRWVVNCAGLEAWRISNMLGFPPCRTNRIKGEYLILDKNVGRLLRVPIYPTPNEQGAFEVHVTPSVEGNVLVGPTLETIGETLDYEATGLQTEVLLRDGRKMFRHVKRENIIRNYVGVFPRIEDPGTGREIDFQVMTSPDIPNVVSLIGITSPGLTSALPLARRVAARIREREDLKENKEFNPVRKGIVSFADQDIQTRRRLIAKDADYGEIFCRCESVTRAEVKQALQNPLGVQTVSGIKYRTRATMGRCQGGYCEMRVTALIRELGGKPREEVLLNKKGAYMFTGKVREDGE